MALVPYTITAIERDTDDATTSEKQVVSGAVCTMTDSAGNVALMYDDAVGANPSTAKTTNGNGQVVVFVYPDIYTLTTNGIARKVKVDGSITVEFETFAEISGAVVQEGHRVICRERANAEYIVKPAGWVLQPGDVTSFNGLVLSLQIDGECKLSWFGAAQDAESLLDAATDDLIPCQQAALRMLQEGGGTILMSGLAALSGTLEIPQRVIFKGTSRFFANQYTNIEARAGGCGFYALPSTNANIIDIKLDVYNDSGTLRESINNKVLSDYRHFGGVRDLIIYGNRSDTANPPIVKDKNTIGDGVVISGSRYPVIENIVIMFCAEKGLRCVSFDYGVGTISCNNLFTSSIVTLSNAAGGIGLSGGDNIMRGLYSGYNGGAGIVSTAARGIYEFTSWNNKEDGIFITGGDDAEYRGVAYDNDRGGWRISSSLNCTVSGRSGSNGRDATKPDLDRVGVLSSADNINLSINIEDNSDYLGTPYQQYGFRILQTANKVNLNNSSSVNNVISDWLISNPLMINLHGNLPSGGEHAGFTLRDRILCAGHEVAQIGGISGNSWQGATVSAGVLNVGRNSFVTLTEASPVNVTDILSSIEGLPIVTFRVSTGSAVTFVNNGSKLRLNGLANKVVNPNESITFMFVSGSVWQEV